MNYFSVQGAVIAGIQAIPVSVECVQSRRLPFLQILGGRGGDVSELRERVIAALGSCGIRLPSRKITVQFQPGVRGLSLEHLDLAVAVAILGSCGLIPSISVQGLMICGGLALDGGIRSVGNRAALRRILRDLECRSALLSWDDSIVLDSYPAEYGGGFRHLREVIGFLKGQSKGTRKEDNPTPLTSESPAQRWREVTRQGLLLRLLEISAAGSHHLLLRAPGLSRPEIAAQTLSALLPPLESVEREEVEDIYALAGLDLPPSTRPVASVGGSIGLPPLLPDRRFAKFEEILLAHRGVLFIERAEERPSEFFRSIQQPMSKGSLHTRLGARRVDVPVEVLVLASVAACGCGGRGDTLLACKCRLSEVRRLQERWRRLLRFPFDLAFSLSTSEFFRPKAAGGFEECKDRVARARKRMLLRQGVPNARLADSELFLRYPWSKAAQRMWEIFDQRSGSLRLRSFAMGKVAITISDLRDGSEVEEMDLLEAKHYFSEGDAGWGESRKVERPSVSEINSKAIP